MDAMPPRDMFFWFFLTIFGTGTFIIFEQHFIWGAAQIVIGLIGMIGCAWPYLEETISGHAQPTRQRLQWIGNPRVFSCVAMVAVLLISAGIYRHYHRGIEAKPQTARSQQAVPPKAASPEQPDRTLVPSSKTPQQSGKLRDRRPNQPMVRQGEHAISPPVSGHADNATGSSPVVVSPEAKTLDRTQPNGSPPNIIPADPEKAVEVVNRMRNSLIDVIGKKETITFLMSWSDDDSSYLAFISQLLSSACRTSPRQCWFTQPGDGRDLDRPPIPSSGRSGITVHGRDAHALASALGAWFSTYSTSTFPSELNGYKDEATKEIIWIEIGPGSPWKTTTR